MLTKLRARGVFLDFSLLGLWTGAFYQFIVCTSLNVGCTSCLLLPSLSFPVVFSDPFGLTHVKQNE